MLLPLAVVPKPPRVTVLEPLDGIPGFEVIPWGIDVTPPLKGAPTCGIVRFSVLPAGPLAKKYQP